VDAADALQQAGPVAALHASMADKAAPELMAKWGNKAETAALVAPVSDGL